LCISGGNFPLLDEDLEKKVFGVSSQQMFKTSNKTKFHISAMKLHHLSGFIYIKQIQKTNHFLSAVATDSHNFF
jgi:DNA polymerase III sliding clamp (beta) subunit (PCNA family)